MVNDRERRLEERLHELELEEQRFLILRRTAIEIGAWGTPGIDRDLEAIRREAGTVRAELEELAPA